MSTESAQLDALQILVSTQTNKLSQQIHDLTERITLLSAQCADLAATARTTKKLTKATPINKLPFAVGDDDEPAAVETTTSSVKPTSKPSRGKLSAIDEAINAFIQHVNTPSVTRALFDAWRGDGYKGIRTEAKIKDMLLAYASSLPDPIKQQAVMFVATRA